MTVLSVMIVRIAAIVRGMAVGYVVVQVLIWHAFYLARPWTLWGPAVAVAWGCGAIAYLRHCPPRWPLICADTAVYAALAVGAAWCVPLATTMNSQLPASPRMASGTHQPAPNASAA